jgi:hypothetical protein
MFKISSFLVAIFVIGCAHGEIESSYTKVSDAFIGTWVQSQNCKVHETMSGNVSIKRNDSNPKELEIQWVNREFSTFNGIGKINYIDYEKKSYQISTDIETFDEGRTVIFASIWKRTEGDIKNIAVIMKKYQLNEKDELIYEKYGYTAFKENKKLQLKSYSDFFPANYHCVMTRKK